MNKSGSLFTLQQTMQSAALAWGLVDVQTMGLSFCNPALERHLELCRLPSPLNLQIFAHAKQAITECLETGKEVSTELPESIGHWHFSPVLADEGIAAVQCYVLQPRTPLHQSQLELGLGHINYFEVFLDHLPYQVWIATPHGELTWLNRALHEYAYGQVLPLNLNEGIWIDIVHPDDLATVNTGLSRALITGKSTGYRLRIKHHDGDYHWFFASLSPVKNDEGQALYWVGANLSIDGLRQSENQLRDQITTLNHQLMLKQRALEQSETHLAQAQKMSMVNQLSAGVVHDMKNLLFISGLHAGLLQKQLAEPEQREHVDVILNTLQKAGSLASNLTGFSSRKSMQLAAADPRVLVRDLETLLNKAVGQNASLQLHIAASVWPISVDKLYFENSLINLCINARDATEARGQITLTMENMLLKRPSHVGEHVMVSVTDNGTGMSQEVLARIFDMFFTTKPEGEGAGLGLPMVKNFMDQVHGLIEVESTPGLGTTVSLYFPRAAPQTASLDQNKHSEKDAPATILLIEPDLDTRNTIAKQLYEQGYEIVTAYQPEVALRYISNGLKVNLVIVANQVPGLMSITQMQDQLSAKALAIPIIITGVESGMRSESKDKLLGASDCVTMSNPLNVDELAHTVQSLLNADRADSQDSSFDQLPA
ncbi:PAS domain-containing protein [Comamonas sp. Y33R10-2]|uniref:ATP-binding protein n=1 Tax=Comamonas sp. Y33R10-2 TaxID=2853257 RepID=UPI001C5CA2F6|nr:ATP-binding protein [Comamonas sp. Y33R10-2]QXZ11186.1 PAS domain-containing protein [Comamonas sp. Y33R10-2]